MISFIEEFENHSKKRENSVKENNRFHHRSDSTKNLTDIYSHDNSLINSISKLRFNLTAKPSKSTSKTKPRKREGNTII